MSRKTRPDHRVPEARAIHHRLCRASLEASLEPLQAGLNLPGLTLFERVILERALRDIHQAVGALSQCIAEPPAAGPTPAV